MAATYRQYILPWTPLPDDDGRLKRILIVVLGVSLLLSLAVPLIPVPKEDRSKVEPLPPHLAQLVMEKQKPKPKPKPKPIEKKKAEKKPEKKKEKKAEKKKPEKKPQPKQVKPPKPQVDRVAEARKKAASTGLLAFSDELADLRETPKLKQGKPLVKGAEAAKPRQRKVLTAGPASSGGIDTSGLSAGVGRSELAGRQTTQVESPTDLVAAAPAVAADKAGKKPSRTYEEVSLVFDRNKGAIYSLYSRALRKDPTLQGKVVLEITIDPSGKVTKCRIVSSELNNPALERKLVARVKMLNFGAREVETLVVTYPIDFLPS